MLNDNRQCRLGKWYATASSEGWSGDPEFRRLDGPHARVHTHAREVVRLFNLGQREEAAEKYRKMEEASVEVLAILERLSSR